MLVKEVERIVYVDKEVPVEKIVVKEVLKEVEIEKIVTKEVPVEIEKIVIKEVPGIRNCSDFASYLILFDRPNISIIPFLVSRQSLLCGITISHSCPRKNRSRGGEDCVSRP